MLGLVSCTNLMDTLVYPPHHTLGLRLPICRRSYNQNSPVSPEPDPILEDTPDLPDDRDIDYSVIPPDVGLTVLVDEIGCEVSSPDTPSKQGKRALCSFSSNVALNGEDLDDYPFHVVSYGENSSCFGLPYNDHNYASTETHSKTVAPVNTVNATIPNSENEDRLTLLAKLALAKDDKQSTKLDFFLQKTTASSNSERGQSYEDSSPALAPVSTLDSTQRLSPPRTTVTKSSLDMFTPVNGATPYTMTAGGNRALILPSPSAVKTVTAAPTTNQPPPPLQVHRVTSSLTPHVVLRTGVPGLQISTTVSRVPSSLYPVDPSNCIRCVCGYTHADGCIVQCEKCCSWLHANCIAPSNGAAISSPYVCERCTTPRSTPTATLTIQRHQLSNLTGKLGNGNTSIRVSRTAALGTGSASGRIFVAPAVNTTASRQLHLCLPQSTGRTQSTVQVSRADVKVLPTTAQLAPGAARYISLVTQSTPYIAQTQPLRSSKRKQDLLTLTGNSTNAGLDCLPDSNGSSSETGTTQTPELHITVSNESTVSTLSPPIGSVIAKNVYTTVSQTTGSTGKMTGSSLQRLLMQCPDHHNQEHQRHSSLTNGIEEVRIDGSSPISTISSDSVRSPPLDGYEEASDLRVSDRLFDKLESMIPSHDPVSAISSLSAFSMDSVPPQLSSLHRCQVVCFEFNRKGLVASEDLSPQQPVIEYRGLCMLLSEYNEMYDYRKHYNPFVLFYKTWPKMALCVDARKYGNEARFIRRSCTPNCEVKHCLSITVDPLSGPIPRIRLLIIANRPIMRNTELTLPFDFDFMACRYLVKCACARKGCPVARWFRQTTQTDATAHNSNSLMYSRKLPFNSRAAASNNRPHRGLLPSTQDNYSDILADSFDPDERQSSSNWSDNRLDEDNLPPVGRLWPHRTFRRVSRVSSSAHRPNGITRPVRRRGRTRGRHRTVSDFGHPTTLRGPAKGLLKSSTRGRPPGSGSRLRLSRSQRQRGSHLIGRSRMHGRYSHFEAYCHVPDADESDQEFAVSVPSLHSPVRQSSNHSKVRERRQSYATTDDGDVQSGYSHQWMMSTDDLDADTEPEYESDRKITSSSNQQPVYSRSRTLLSPLNTDSNENNEARGLLEGTPSTIDVMSFGLEPDSCKSTKPSRHQAADPTGRRKRRVSGADGITQSFPPRKVPTQDNKKKSREEIWMDEVLRRIERMEKKQQQHKQRPISSEKQETREPIESVTQIEDTLSHSTNSAPDKPEPEDLSNECSSITQTVVVKPSVFCNPKSEQEEQLVFPELMDSPPPTPTSPLLEKLKNEISNQTMVCAKKTDDTDKIDALVQNGHTIADSVMPLSARSFNKQTEVSKVHSKRRSVESSLRNKRRRSQTVILSDALISDSIKRRDSREDRWLKSQLRRIAELEDQTIVTSKDKDQSAPTDPRTNSGDIPETEEVEQGCPPDGVNEKDASDVTVPETTSISFALDTQNRRRRRQSSPGGQTDSSSLSFTRSPPAKCGDPINSGAIGTDSEADCRLIVYRTREKDPMAKFSRNRKVGIGMGEAPNDHLPETNVENGKSTHISNVFPAPSTQLTNSTHSTPRPTKKRWLSQALMEEEDSSQYSKLEPVSVSDPVGDRMISPEDSSPIERTLVHSVLTTCPVNPKKRLISQFSGAGDEQPICATPSLSDSTQGLCTNSNAFSASSAISTEEIIQTTPAKLSQDQASVGIDKPSMELSTLHSTPLPPKKATVKQQAEQLRQQEMRKIRVSLSEYRRRRGLSSVTNNKPKPDQHIPKPSIVEQLESILPPGLVGSGLLTEELPKHYDQLRLNPTVSTESQRAAVLDPSPMTFFQDSTVCDHTPFNYTVGKSDFDVLPSTPEKRMTERGPRTPSEPPDDEGDDDLGAELENTVYGRQVNDPHLITVAVSPTGPSNGIRWSTDRFLQRTADLSSRLYQTGYPASDEKLVPVIAHSQFPRAAGRDAGVNGCCVLSHVTSSESPLSTTSPGELVSHPTKQIYSPPKPLNSFREDGTCRSDSRLRNCSSSLSASTGSPNHSSPLPPPPPPPPPPLPPTLSANTLVDLESSSPTKPAPQRRFSGSDVTTAHVGRDLVPETNSLEYFIRRDQEIRHWQEARSYNWDRRRRSAYRKSPAADMHTYTRHYLPHRRHAWRNPASNAHNYPFRSGLGEKCARHANTGVASPLLDVEQTLHRLEDTIRAQLDRTRLALTSHTNLVSVDRTSSLNGTGCAMMTSAILSYPRDHLEINRHVAMTEQRIRTSSSPS